MRGGGAPPTFPHCVRLPLFGALPDPGTAAGGLDDALAPRLSPAEDSLREAIKDLLQHYCWCEPTQSKASFLRTFKVFSCVFIHSQFCLNNKL